MTGPGDHSGPPRTPSDPVPPAPARPATSSGPRQVRAAGLVLTIRAVVDADRIDVAGELTVGTAALLDGEVVDVCLWPAGPRLDLVLDLTGITFLDVAGVAGLRRAHCRATVRGAVRLGLPVAPGPRRLVDLAVGQGWLPPAFRPGVPAA